MSLQFRLLHAYSTALPKESSDSSNKSEIETAIQKFESAVMIPGVKTRISDLLRKNVK